MTAVILLHGAFRSPGIWGRVTPRLAAAGHDVVCPDLTSPDATLTSYIDTVVGAFDRHDLRDVILVGHSQGGFVARAASNRVADRVRGLVYLDAPVPRHGQMAFDFRPERTPLPEIPQSGVFEAPPATPNDFVTRDDAAFINSLLVPQAGAPSLERVVLDDPAALALDEHYAFFSETPSYFPCAITRAQLDRAGSEYTLLPGPHDAIVTNAADVAAFIDRCC